MDRKVVVTGAAQTKFNRRKDDSSFRDWAAQAFDDALEMSGIERAEIDALFIASESDFFSLQLNPVALFASELGLTGAAGMRCEAGGASGQAAVQAAAMAVLSGQARHVAVIGVDPSASSLSGDTIRRLYGFSFDAMTDGFSRVTATALYALSWQIFASDQGLGDAELALVTQQNRANARANPDAHLPREHSLQEITGSPLIAAPYRRLHCAPLSDGAAALILSAAECAPEARKRAPRIAGMGAATDHMHLGARDAPGDFSAKQKAMQRACQNADVTPIEIGLAELYDSYAGAQLQGLAALGLSDAPGADLDAGAFAPDGRCPVNLSGGLMGQGAPVGAIGVAQVASCARMLEGVYHDRLQPNAPPAYALADTHGAICTTAAVTILQNGGAA
ncbi:MAG: thiolase family protein [Pseudomonadota bacterium]